MIKLAGAGVGVVIFGIILNFAFWGGLFYFALWALREFNII